MDMNKIIAFRVKDIESSTFYIKDMSDLYNIRIDSEDSLAIDIKFSKEKYIGAGMNNVMRNGIRFRYNTSEVYEESKLGTKDSNMEFTIDFMDIYDDDTSISHIAHTIMMYKEDGKSHINTGFYNSGNMIYHTFTLTEKEKDELNQLKKDLALNANNVELLIYMIKYIIDLSNGYNDNVELIANEEEIKMLYMENKL